MLKILFNENRLDFMASLLSEKKYREYLCKKYIEDNHELSIDIIKEFDYQMINNKYVLKNRMYVEGSYSKSKIKKQEIQFISKLILFRHFQNEVICNLDFFYKIKKYTHEELYITDNEYQTILYVYNNMQFDYSHIDFLDVDNRVDVETIWDVLEFKGVREKMTQHYVNDDTLLSNYLIEKNNYMCIHDKYITKINDYTNNSYSRNKIKDEEINFCIKVISFERWKCTVKDLVEYIKYYKIYFSDDQEKIDEYLLKIIYEKLHTFNIVDDNQK
ncbi:hypothetical protein RZE82_02215 [Mollicutes bacterium LVI A0039]|nr:hypothetical protein RZE82_02215 [Mollicutes bacterium LVI A0039]